MKKTILAVLVLLMCMMVVCASADSWKCAKCGKYNSTAFCPDCGSAKPDDSWICSKCGRKNTTNFCPTDGTARTASGSASSTTKAIYGQINQKLALNDGPGTKRYFNELGGYGTAGEYVHILARAWDPNNGIWWIKVEYPTGSGFTGWTGYKRFVASSFRLEDVPQEKWY